MPGLRRFIALAALLTYVALSPAPVAGISSGVVISQVYGGGGNAGSTFTNDFIELHNRGTSPVSLNGWSVQYNSAAGTSAWQVTNLSGSIPAGGYYLVQEAMGTGGTTSLHKRSPISSMADPGGGPRTLTVPSRRLMTT